MLVAVMVLKRWLIILLMCPLMAVAQNVDFDNEMADWLEEGASEEALAEMNDLLLQLRENPVNINDTAAVAALPFITPFQHKALCYYIMLHGQLLTLKELAFVPGFDSVTRALIEPLVKVEPYSGEGSFRPWQGRHNLVTGLGGTIEQADGYASGRYEGDNLRALMCYTYNYRNQLSIRFSADKDPTEAWGKGNYYGYHIMLSDMGRLRRLIAGRYNLQFGQGLTMWTGMAPFNIVGIQQMRFGGGIKPASTFYEENYLEGVAATVDVGAGIDATAFASRVNDESLLGGRVSYRNRNLLAGFTMAYTMLNDSVQMRDYVYNARYFRGDHLLNMGVDAVWQWNRLTLYGEAAFAGDSGRVALAAGAMVKADSRNQIGLCYRRYDEVYHNIYAQGYAIGSTQNEHGVSLDAICQLPLKINSAISLDLHSFPAPRYGAYMPSSGSWLRVRMNRSFGRWMDASLRYAYRGKERNIPNLDSAIYAEENTLRQQLQAELRATTGGWALSLRGVYCWFDAESVSQQHGWAISAAGRYTYQRLQLTMGGVWFDVDGYYARLYMSESNLQYAWSMPALNGKGLRSYALVRYALSGRLSLAAKYSILYMPEVSAIGSGDARTEGNHRQAWHMQLRIKL